MIFGYLGMKNICLKDGLVIFHMEYVHSMYRERERNIEYFFLLNPENAFHLVDGRKSTFFVFFVVAPFGIQGAGVASLLGSAPGHSAAYGKLLYPAILIIVEVFIISE